MSRYIIYNNSFYREEAPILSCVNRGFKYGEGVFETMRLSNAELRLFNFHMERLFRSLEILRFTLPEGFAPAFLKNKIYLLLEKNKLKESARIRLSVFRGTEELSQHQRLYPNYVIEAFRVPPAVFNPVGIKLGIFREGKKSTDVYSTLKSSQYLTSTMSLLDAAEKHVDENVLLNCHNRVCETSKANIFCIKDGSILTPPLSEGCVNGVMRKFLLQNGSRLPLPVKEVAIRESELLEADEIFVTNALHPVRYVRKIDGMSLKNKYSKEIAAFLYHETFGMNQNLIFE